VKLLHDFSELSLKRSSYELREGDQQAVRSRVFSGKPGQAKLRFRHRRYTATAFACLLLRRFHVLLLVQLHVYLSLQDLNGQTLVA
jgi:hypothetical protein